MYDNFLHINVNYLFKYFFYFTFFSLQNNNNLKKLNVNKIRNAFRIIKKTNK